TGSSNSFTISAVNTSTTVAWSPSTSVKLGQSVTFTATVAAASPSTAVVNTGTVQFVVDGVNFGSPGNVVGGTATSAATTSLTEGNHTVQAVFSDGSSFNSSTGSQAGTVTAMHFTSSINQVSTTYGDTLTYTITITNTDGGNNSLGSVT